MGEETKGQQSPLIPLFSVFTLKTICSLYLMLLMDVVRHDHIISVVHSLHWVSLFYLIYPPTLYSSSEPHHLTWLPQFFLQLLEAVATWVTGTFQSLSHSIHHSIIRIHHLSLSWVSTSKLLSFIWRNTLCHVNYLLHFLLITCKFFHKFLALPCNSGM